MFARNAAPSYIALLFPYLWNEPLFGQQTIHVYAVVNDSGVGKQTSFFRVVCYVMPGDFDKMQFPRMVLLTFALIENLND